MFGRSPFKCPNCGHRLTQREVRRLFRVWTGVRHGPCEACGAELAFATSLRPRLQAAAIVFRVAVLAFAALLLAYLAGWIGERGLRPGLSLAGMVVLVGILMTRVRGDSPFEIQRENSDD
jgi:uncharacterized protein (DUF983 family)